MWAQIFDLRGRVEDPAVQDRALHDSVILCVVCG